MNGILNSVIVLVVSLTEALAIVAWWKRGWLQRLVDCLLLVELDQHFLCGYSLTNMIMTQFINRFGDFNDEGFCYTFSAAIALSLKKFRTTRIVRGQLSWEDYGKHSWVETKLLGRWWVVDPVLLRFGCVNRRYYYRVCQVEVDCVYRYQEIWHMVAAEQFYKRLSQPETSYVFVELYWFYTPKRGEQYKLIDRGDVANSFLDDIACYRLFSSKSNFKFNQRIVNELMARPTRRSPKRHTLRRFESSVRRNERAQNQTPAPR